MSLEYPFVSLVFNVKLHHSPSLHDHPTELYITIGLQQHNMDKWNFSRKIFCCCFFTSCFLFPIAGQLKAKQRFVSPKSGEKKTKPCINVFKHKFNPSTLKRIEEGNWFILYYFYLLIQNLFTVNPLLGRLYLFQTAPLRKGWGVLIESGA